METLPGKNNVGAREGGRSRKRWEKHDSCMGEGVWVGTVLLLERFPVLCCCPFSHSVCVCVCVCVCVFVCVWCERIKQNCTPRHNKHKSLNARCMLCACCLLNSARSLSAISSIKKNKKSQRFRPRKTVLSPLTSEVLYKTNSEWPLFVQWNKILYSVKDETLYSTRLRLVE